MKAEYSLKAEIKRMAIQAVFFDMGGTIETFSYTRELRLAAIPGLRQCLSRVGLDLDLSDEQLLDVVSGGLDRYKAWSIRSNEELPSPRVWKEYVFAGLGLDLAKLDAIAEDLACYVETRFFKREMRPEVPAVLEAIRQMGIKIGIVSNVNSRGQVPTNLRGYGIHHYFDPIVLSSEYGRRKPDPSIFHYAARLARVPTSACLYVGDRVARDIVGARRAGYGLAVLIQHDFDHGEDDGGGIPDFSITRMTELLDILHADLARSTPMDASEAEPGRKLGILFDAGDLLYYRPNGGDRFRRFLTELERQPGPAAQKKLLTQQAYTGQIQLAEYRESLVRLHGVDQPELVERGMRILDEEDNNVRFFAGVKETLLTLKRRGFLLAIVTDTASPIHVKLSWFERGGFGHVWDSITSSREVGACKPDPKIYQAALETLGIRPGNAVFVGHNALELEGAHAVGMGTIAFNYDAGAKADYFIREFPDLLKIPILS